MSETGETCPDLGTLVILSEIFGCSVDALVHGGHCAGKYRRRVTVAQMREAIGCIHRMYDLLGSDHFLCQTVISALDARLNSSIVPAFADPRIMDAYICEALISCVRDCGDWADLHDVRRNIPSPGPREATIRCLQELGMR